MDEIMAELDKARPIERVGCVKCGDTNDLMARLSRIPICGKCARKNYRKAVGR